MEQNDGEQGCRQEKSEVDRVMSWLRAKPFDRCIIQISVAGGGSKKSPTCGSPDV